MFSFYILFLFAPKLAEGFNFVGMVDCRARSPVCCMLHDRVPLKSKVFGSGTKLFSDLTSRKESSPLKSPRGPLNPFKALVKLALLATALIGISFKTMMFKLQIILGRGKERPWSPRTLFLVFSTLGFMAAFAAKTILHHKKHPVVDLSFATFMKVCFISVQYFLDMNYFLHVLLRRDRIDPRVFSSKVMHVLNALPRSLPCVAHLISPAGQPSQSLLSFGPFTHSSYHPDPRTS